MKRNRDELNLVGRSRGDRLLDSMYVKQEKSLQSKSTTQTPQNTLFTQNSFSNNLALSNSTDNLVQKPPKQPLPTDTQRTIPAEQALVRLLPFLSDSAKFPKAFKLYSSLIDQINPSLVPLLLQSVHHITHSEAYYLAASTHGGEILSTFERILSLDSSLFSPSQKEWLRLVVDHAVITRLHLSTDDSFRFSTLLDRINLLAKDVESELALFREESFEREEDKREEENRGEGRREEERIEEERTREMEETIKKIDKRSDATPRSGKEDGGEESGEEASEREEETAKTREKEFDVPQGEELLKEKQFLLFQLVRTIYALRNKNWAKVTIEKFFNDLYRSRERIFSSTEHLERVEEMQNQMKQHKVSATLPVIRGILDSKHEVKDSRETKISTTHGVTHWSNRQ